MTSVVVRNLTLETKQRLVRRAALNKRSLEAELRLILAEAAVAGPEEPDDLEPLGSWLFRISRPGLDLEKLIEDGKAGDRPMVSFEECG